MTRPVRARIDIDALRHNFSRMAGLAAPARCYAVIKADAYGHGIGQVAQALGDALKFAVASIEEALQIRQAGVTRPVLLLEGCFEPDELEVCQLQGFEVMLHEEGQLQAVLEKSFPQPLNLWLKINTGMNRLGFAPDVALQVLARLRQHPQVQVLGAMTHFASADELDLEHALAQLKYFETWQQAAGGDLQFAAANSAAIAVIPSARFQWARPGIMLYGSSPFAHRTADEFGLRPVMKLESALISVRELAAGDKVGYGAAWTAPGPARMGVVAVGYADGYPRHAPAGTPVMVNGVRVPLIGRVSMDMISLDLTGHPEARVGDPVQLWGDQLSVDEIARCAGTISYELLTGVTQRVPRVYE